MLAKNSNFFLIALIFFSVSCGGKKANTQEDTLTSGIIQIVVDENLRSVVDAEIDVFAVHHSQALIVPSYTDEKGAINMLTSDSVRLAIVARDITDYERSQFKSNRIIRKYPFAYEGVALLSNQNNEDTILSVSQLRKILTGEITTWQQLNPNSKDETINIYFSDKNTGIMQYLIDSVVHRSKVLSKNVYAFESGKEMINQLIDDKNAIGIIGLNQLGNENSKKYEDAISKIRFMRLKKTENAPNSESYLPYAGDVYNGDYPLWRPLYILLSESREGLAKGFCFFLTQEIGQKVVLKAGLMPITDANKRLTYWTE